MITGFIQYTSLHDHVSGNVAVLGELSEYSATYAIENTVHDIPATYPGIQFVSFRNRGRITNPVPAAPTYDQVNRILQIAHWIYEEASGGFFTDDRTTALQAFMAEFDAVGTGFSIGQMVTNGSIYMPEWVSWKNVVDDGSGNMIPSTPFKVWLCDQSFRNQYSQYDIAFVPPVANLDVLHGSRTQVQTALGAKTMAQLMRDITTIKNKNPDTEVRTLEYEWVDKLDPTFKIMTNWSVIIWGAAAFNEDIIRDEMMEYILDNSTFPRSEWETALPDMFVSTEFLFVPNWDQYAIPNQTLQAGIYSPLAKPGDLELLGVKGMPALSEAHRSAYMRAGVHPYRSISFVVCGGERNLNAVYDFSAKFPDYFTVQSTTHVDFNRMSPSTQQWYMKFSQALNEAEKMDESSEVPQGFSRLTRNNLYYISFNFERVQYLVLLKKGQSADTPIPSDFAGWLRVNGAWVQHTSGG